MPRWLEPGCVGALCWSACRRGYPKATKPRARAREKQGLSIQQLQILREYKSGELRRQANKLTMISGHGRLKKEDHSFVDIGGSTGGFVRTVLDDWEPPDLADFEGDQRLADQAA